MSLESCPFHGDEGVFGQLVSAEVGQRFVCERRNGHPAPGAYEWLRPPEPPALAELTGLAAELGLDVELPAALAGYRGRWVEYGVLEAAYAAARPEDFARLVARYGHTAVHDTQYSASAYLAAVLKRLHDRGVLAFAVGPATGRWAYNSKVSWWSLPPAPDWQDPATHLSWQAAGLDTAYVPGGTETAGSGG